MLLVYASSLFFVVFKKSKHDHMLLVSASSLLSPVKLVKVTPSKCTRLSSFYASSLLLRSPTPAGGGAPGTPPKTKMSFFFAFFRKQSSTIFFRSRTLFMHLLCTCYALVMRLLFILVFLFYNFHIFHFKTFIKL
jgi:hypothetical protein